jgi:Glycosyl hydrolases family 18
MARRFALALTAVALLTASVLAQPAAQAGGRAGYWPRQVYAPYFETWTADSIPAIAAKSGARYFSLAFLQTAKAGSCALTWNGTKTQPVPGAHYQGQIARLRQLGGDVMPTFGGFGADSTRTEIADSCTSVSKIAADYESVITAYHVTRLDMDVEVNSLANTAGIDRRNKAIALVEAWARRCGWPLQIQYTLPVEPTGLEADALHVLKNAIADGARVDTVNIMTFDYYLAKEPKPLDMGAEAITAARNVHRQLAALYPGYSQRHLWAMEGITILPGIDDYPGKTEITYLGDTRRILDFARANGLGLLSAWAIQRDNGGCPGAIDSNSCSGIKQPAWAFSHLLEPFTSWF